MKRALFLVLPHFHFLDLAGPAHILQTIPELALGAIDVQYVSPTPQVRSFQGIGVTDLKPLPDRLNPGDAVFVIGRKLSMFDKQDSVTAQAVEWLRQIAARTAGLEVISICTGAFMVGQAGLLDGRLCTTHHGFVRKLQAEFPRARVLENRVFVRDGMLITSAGVTTGIDAALEFVSRHFGMEAALAVAQENVATFRSFSGDGGAAPEFEYRNHINPVVHKVQNRLSRLIVSGSGETLSVIKLASECHVSYRQLARVFRRETGVSIKQYHQHLRLSFARQLMVQEKITLETIAERCGFSSPQAFRAAWNKFDERSIAEYRTIGTKN